MIINKLGTIKRECDECEKDKLCYLVEFKKTKETRVFCKHCLEFRFKTKLKSKKKVFP